MTAQTIPTLPDAFGMVVRFTLKPGHEEAFDELMVRTVAVIRQHEPGTLAYVVHHVEGEPLTRIFYELYADPAAFEHHESGSHLSALAAERRMHVDAVHVDRLSVLTDAGMSAAGGR